MLVRRVLLDSGFAATRRPDGYELSFGSNTTHVLNGAVHPLQYDVLNDFKPVSLIPTNPLLVIAKKTMPAPTKKRRAESCLMHCNKTRLY
jgi:tripartite-type tricarboxylate transporter receptor subunit TctC